MGLEKFLSRKLFVAIGAIVTAVSAGEYIAAAGIAVAYLVAQGFVDAVAARKLIATVNAEVDNAQEVVAAVDAAAAEQGA